MLTPAGNLLMAVAVSFFFFSSRRRHTRYIGDWSSDVCSSDLGSGFFDVLTGNGVSNVLTGGGGNDKLAGAAGNDILAGGAGADTFIFGSAALADAHHGVFDRITDYNQGNSGSFSFAENDRIDVSAL